MNPNANDNTSEALAPDARASEQGEGNSTVPDVAVHSSVSDGVGSALLKPSTDDGSPEEDMQTEKSDVGSTGQDTMTDAPPPNPHLLGSPVEDTATDNNPAVENNATLTEDMSAHAHVQADQPARTDPRIDGDLPADTAPPSPPEKGDANPEIIIRAATPGPGAQQANRTLYLAAETTQGSVEDAAQRTDIPATAGTGGDAGRRDSDGVSDTPLDGVVGPRPDPWGANGDGAEHVMDLIPRSSSPAFSEGSGLSQLPSGPPTPPVTTAPPAAAAAKPGMVSTAISTVSGWLWDHVVPSEKTCWKVASGLSWPVRSLADTMYRGADWWDSTCLGDHTIVGGRGWGNRETTMTMRPYGEFSIEGRCNKPEVMSGAYSAKTDSNLQDFMDKLAKCGMQSAVKGSLYMLTDEERCSKAHVPLGA